MSDQGKTASQCIKCAYWDRGLCHHGMTAEQDHGRAKRCLFFTRDASAFAFFVKDWRC